MFNRVTAIAAMAIWLVFVGSTQASEERWAGAWTWTVEGRTAFVLRFSPDAAGGLTGTFSKPERFTLDANAGWVRLMNVEPSVSTGTISVSSVSAREVRFTAPDANPAEPPTAYVLTRVSDDAADLGLADIPGAPTFAMRRAEPDTTVATDWESGRVYGQAPVFPDNADLARLFEADQAARQGPAPLADGVESADAARRGEVRRMLDAGQVRSAADYVHAAFIFQHGGRPEDFLLAHALATAAVARGRPDAIWIATATLDRYLQSIGRPQIYGTQFQVPRDGSGATQGAFDRELLPDTVRIDSGVPVLADQERQRALYDAR